MVYNKHHPNRWTIHPPLLTRSAPVW